MKIPALLMASLLTAGVSAQSTKPLPKNKKPEKKVKKAADPEPEKPKPGKTKTIVKKDTLVLRGYGCPACGMG
ncbi:hypothetical protein F3J23_11670 [Chryseobacterium sp. Tr-659]|uniref:MNIO class RiPP chryseobasin precursor ChrA n=1 Tax=Chryseobacterium sp. Tr-659 TaxID=2608340 RepID=UPI001420AB46|nr:hypothetical protein [Chryseobacterium sp. Tr-659]NIF06098.1 hypothetical protein [Chryseobacterium sp. Tr-659]